MYPSTFPGEVSKRDLDTDDESAVQYLYTGNAQASMAPQAGCSTVGSHTNLSWLFAFPLLLLRRR